MSDLKNNDFYDTSKLTATTGTFKIHVPELSDWTCYMFGNKPNSVGLVYVPENRCVPNWFIRWMMKICFGCTWIKKERV